MTPKFVVHCPCRTDIFIDLTNQRFGRIVALKSVRHAKHKKPFWVCLCDCGQATVVDGQSLRNGRTTSCGCFSIEQRVKANSRHGHWSGGVRSRTYRSWYAMKQRCNNPHSTGYSRYGGRGISHDPRWNSFEEFFSDMGERPDGSQLDRIDNDGNYEKINCRWVSAKENVNNRSNTRKVEIAGRKYDSIPEVARLHGLKESTVACRYGRGWRGEKLISALSPSRWDTVRPRCVGVPK